MQKKNGIDQIADAIISALEKGEAPWQRPWDASASSSLFATNPTTGASYRGANRLMLAIQGRSDNRWMTFNQAKAKGWKIKKGEKGVPIVKFVDHEFSKETENEQGEKEISKEKALVAKTYFVFNGEQIEGIPPLEMKDAIERDLGDISRAEIMIEALIERTGLSVRHGGDKAFYSPGSDLIQMPTKESFHSGYDWAATALHEASHSTLHEKRLDRKEALGKRFGDQAYALEELRAEISSFFLAGETGISQTEEHRQNHSQYCGSWLKALKNDKREIIRACSDAERICGFILDNEKEFLKERQETKRKESVANAAGMEAVMRHRAAIAAKAPKAPAPAIRISI